MESSTQSQTGYNIELFIDSEIAQKYLCSICHHVVSDCHETRCGHIFCGGCISRIIINIPFKCPHCNQNNRMRAHQSIYLNRAVKNLRVQCPFNEKGCKWIGLLSDLMIGNGLQHLMKCLYAPIQCNQCNQKLCRAEYENHKKQCLKYCTICKITFNSSNHRKLHYQKCPLMVECKHCKQKILGTELNHHISFLCSLRKIKCPFYHFGCNEVIKSLNLTNHLKYNAAQHYQLKVDHCINKIEKMKIQIDQLLKINNKYRQQNESLTKQLKMYKIKKPEIPTPITPTNTNIISDAPHSYDTPDILFLFGSNKWEETGVFIRRSQLHENRVCYTSLRTKCAIRWNSELIAWLIDRRGLKKDNEASLIAYQDVIHPGLVNTNWLVYNHDIQEWQQSNNYKIKSLNLAEFIFNTDQIFASCSNHKILNFHSKLFLSSSSSSTSTSTSSLSVSPQSLKKKDKEKPPGLLQNNQNITNITK